MEEYKARGKSPEEIELRPIVLVGNPGVGKSSLAELMPRLYFHYGLLGSSQPIVVHASELADEYAEDDPRAYEIQTEDIPEMQIVLNELNLL